MFKSFVSVGTFGDRFTSMKVIRVENFHLKPINGGSRNFVQGGY